jgi:hypothetical protein
LTGYVVGGGAGGRDDASLSGSNISTNIGEVDGNGKNKKNNNNNNNNKKTVSSTSILSSSASPTSLAPRTRHLLPSSHFLSPLATPLGGLFHELPFRALHCYFSDVVRRQRDQVRIQHTLHAEVVHIEFFIVLSPPLALNDDEADAGAWIPSGLSMFRTARSRGRCPDRRCGSPRLAQL